MNAEEKTTEKTTSRERKEALMKAVKEDLYNLAKPLVENLVNDTLRKEHLEQTVLGKKMIEWQGKWETTYPDYLKRIETAAKRIDQSIQATEGLRVNEVGLKVQYMAHRLQLSVLRETVATELLWWSRKQNPDNPDATLSLMSNLYEMTMWEDTWWAQRKNFLIADWVKLLTVNFNQELMDYTAGKSVVDKSVYSGVGNSDDDEVDEDVTAIVKEVVAAKPLRVKSKPAQTPSVQTKPQPTKKKGNTK